MNPYQVLGLSEGASPEEINKAYKERLSFYTLADGDNTEQITALNAAYDALMYNGQSTYNSTAGESIKYGDVRAKIREKRMEDAETILDGVPIDARDAEWYYLKGKILHARGWLEEAADCYGKAVYYEPNNSEYANAYNAVKSKRSGEFRNDWRQSNTEIDGCAGSVCKMCTALACCDCLCSLCR
ncbi:MAG: hypothetical protein IJG23_07490 [Clostridia bacterium]|nr:hypothetical protein [Clostridia bacterium]